MPLQQGEVQGYDFNRSVEFTMLNQGKVILCSISTAAMPPTACAPSRSMSALLDALDSTLLVRLHDGAAISICVCHTHKQN